MSTDSDGLLREAQRVREATRAIQSVWDHDDALVRSAALVGVGVTEVRPPARITETCKTFKLVPGSALELQTWWNFSLASHKATARRLVETEKPFHLICVPPCTLFSMLQELQ